MKETLEFPRGMRAEISIEIDDDPMDPTVNEDMAIFNIFSALDGFWKFNEENGWDQKNVLEAVDGAILKGKDGTLYMGLERYSHGVDVYALCNAGKFPDRQWDVSTIVGYISPHPDVDSDVISAYNADPSAANRAELIKRLNQDIDRLNHYLAGRVYGYTVRVFDDDGVVIAEPESCWGFIGDEETCLEEARDIACFRFLPMLTENEIFTCLSTDSQGGLVAYLKNFIKFIIKNDDIEGKTTAELAHRLYHYITHVYVANETNPHVLICRYKGTVQDEYPWLTRAAWGDVVIRQATDKGYWDWVVCELRKDLKKSGPRPLFTVPESGFTGRWQVGAAVPDQIKANIVRLACIRACNMTYKEYLKHFDIVDDGYAREKFAKMQKDFSAWFCGLDSERATQFMEGL